MRVHFRRIVIGLVAVIAASGLAGCSSKNQNTTRGPETRDADTTTIPSAPTTPGNHNGMALPPMKHFRIGGDVYGPVHDCRVDDETVMCTLSWEKPYSVDSYTGTVSATLSGSTMTGMSTTHQTGHDGTDPWCPWEEEITGPVTYVLHRDGTVAMREGPFQWRRTSGGSCSGPDHGTSPATDGTATWSVIE